MIANLTAALPWLIPAYVVGVFGAAVIVGKFIKAGGDE